MSPPTGDPWKDSCEGQGESKRKAEDWRACGSYDLKLSNKQTNRQTKALPPFTRIECTITEVKYLDSLQEEQRMNLWTPWVSISPRDKGCFLVLLSLNYVLLYLPRDFAIPHEDRTVEASFNISEYLREHSD